MNQDPIGLAVYDYWKNGTNGRIIVHSDICEDDEIETAYLFRNIKEMPPLEQFALRHATGKILDVGAAAGSHALALQEKQMDVCALEISHQCAYVMKERGVKNVELSDFYNYGGGKYDTILALMNGTGLAQSIENLPRFFKQLKKLLNVDGQVLIDSSDLRFLYENEDGSLDIDLNNDYYGQVNFQMEYEGIVGEWFRWLYLDVETFRMYADMHGFTFELVHQGKHYDYLARLTVKD